MKTIIACACLLFIAAVGAMAIPPHASAIAPIAADQTR
ncbi:Skp family chaperone for outer membrane proteins [Sphingosinicella soli]|uniref:Skp family chaperone for outer membrane proteins n=1 Tax=Sphingosinicella soli TaxID=333708 RepID=A0A7W7AZM2_9SPHN|nr:Skp family chaperone for outer membrane proteins [Sphingosinicella soli]